MKVKIYFSLAVLCVALINPSVKCYAQAFTSIGLINNAKQYDNQTISYKGEVIGDIMIRKDYAWLHVNDGPLAIGIWAPKVMLQDIRYAGDFHQKGDIVEVSGVFHRSCKEHGGDLDIHALEIKKISSGNTATQPISRKKAHLGILSFILVLLFYLLKKLFQVRPVSPLTKL